MAHFSQLDILKIRLKMNVSVLKMLGLATPMQTSFDMGPSPLRPHLCYAILIVLPVAQHEYGIDIDTKCDGVHLKKVDHQEIPPVCTCTQQFN